MMSRGAAHLGVRTASRLVALLLVPVWACAPAPQVSAPGPIAASPRARPEATAVPQEHLGVLVPRERIPVVAPVRGLLEHVEGHVGDAVRRGQRLARVAADEQRARVASARAAVDAAEAELRRAEVERRVARSVAARRDGAPDVFSAELREAAAAAVEEATARVDALGAHARASRVALEQEKALLEQTILRAPIDGVVTRRWLAQGARVEAGGAVLEIAARQPWVRFALPPTRARAARLGERVRFRADQGGIAFDAEVVHATPEIDAASQMLFVDARPLAALDPELVRPGLVGRVTLTSAVSP